MRHRIPKLLLDLLPGGTEQDEMLYSLSEQRCEHGEVAALVVATGEQDDALVEASHGFLHGSDIGSFGVVEEAHAVALAHQLETMRQPSGVIERLLNRARGGAPNRRRGHRSHHVFAVVGADEVGVIEREPLRWRIRAAVDDLVAIEEGSEFHGIAPEGNGSTASVMALLPDPGVVTIQNQEVARQLRREDRRLGAPVLFETVVAIEMIGGHVQQRCHLRPKGLHPFELEA